MRSVSRFESNLLRILQAILGRVQTSQVMPILVRKHSPPKCLSRDTVELVEQMLAAGCSDLFVRAGGWQRQRFIREQDVVQGRLWERREPKTLGLTFSKNALRFLIWLTATNISDEKERWDAPPQLTLGDELLLFLTYRCLQTTEISDRWCKITPFRDHALCALALSWLACDGLMRGASWAPLSEANKPSSSGAAATLSKRAQPTWCLWHLKRGDRVVPFVPTTPTDPSKSWWQVRQR